MLQQRPSTSEPQRLEVTSRPRLHVGVGSGQNAYVWSADWRFKLGETQKFMLTILETLQADPHRGTAGKVYIHGRWADPMSVKQNIFRA